MPYNLSILKQKLKEAEDRLVKELASVRTGRATPVILDGVLVESYGTKMPINQLANVSVEGARSLRISPYDKSVLKEIEKGITAANLGLGVATDDEGIRVTFPELTSDRRQEMVKVAKEKLEEGRINVRTEREKVWNDIQKQEKEGKLSEDEKFRGKEEMQKLVDTSNKKLEELFSKKEKEIMG